MKKPPLAARATRALAKQLPELQLSSNSAHSGTAAQVRQSGLQREEPVAVGQRIHADLHQAVIGPCGLCWAERPLYEVVRS